ncbi:DUF4384 domain-containing protein [Azospirillum picis]|uniref:DUF4384 domain-containing protein n=1 Tax=Azospirillum picis TaxID=488438 RepID=A0ABU0MQ40_9PROT|nr:DUF4384 domain-containing protein [Azospirillum picis]MBP2302112.1 hypothetical protein [Azospirillum picis]MDQ0535597.1 hypothetical protein [Azospirillum picis]
MARDTLLRLLPAVAVAALACGQAGGLRAEAVVVASNAPGYTLGQLLPDGQAVRLPEGAGATVLFANGRLLRLRGPYDGVPDAAVPSGRPPAGATADDRFVQTDLGAARALGNRLDGALDRALALDPSLPGTYCMRAGSPPPLRRPADPALDRLLLADADGSAGGPGGSGGGGGQGGGIPIAWTAGTPAPWPPSLPLGHGSEVRVLRADGTLLGSLRFHVVEASGAAGMAVGMAAAGCAAQLGAALAALRDAALPLDLSVTAERGPAAAYRPGEDIRLQVRTDRDAHVYCYLRNARAQLVPIFPAGAAKSAEVAGNAPLTLPGERMPLPLRAGDGALEVQCLAAVRDLDGEMPGRAEPFRPLSDADAARLDRTMSGLRDGEAASARLALTIR